MLSIIGRGEGTGSGQIPFTPRAKKSLELALREALSLGSDLVTPEHLLLGLLREGEGVCNRILRELGLDTYALRREVLERAERDRGRRPGGGAPAPPGRGSEAPRSRLAG